MEHCRRRGRESDWAELPPSKSLFHSPPGCGLPIGNLTSQLFSNIYLNGLDRYMVSMLGPGRYGRYVDDFYVVGTEPAELRRLIPLAAVFLGSRLELSPEVNKTAIYSAYRGVEFLGAYPEPFRKYVSSRTLERMERKIARISYQSLSRQFQSINSFLGISFHYRAYNIRLYWIVGPLRHSFRHGYYRRGLLRYRLRNVLGTMLASAY